MSSRYYAMIRQDWRSALWIPFMHGMGLNTHGLGVRCIKWLEERILTRRNDHVVFP